MTPLRRQTLAGSLLFAGGFAGIIAATLWPFSFQFERLSWAAYIARLEWTPSSVLDFPRNVLLFMPFGLGLAILLDSLGVSRGLRFLSIGLAGFLTTMAVESLQVFLPEREGNVWDVVANSTGAIVGPACLCMWQRRESLRLWIRARLVPRNIALAFFTYLLSMVLLVWVLMWSVAPGGWSRSYSLAVGNEITGDRPWHGKLRDLLVLDRSCESAGVSRLLAGEIPSTLDDAIVAVYPLSEESGPGERKSGLPDLAPQAAADPEFEKDGVALNAGMWLATETAVGSLADRINRSRAFTIALTAATSDLEQEGPARIVTLSQDPFHRNVTLGQDHKCLALRWRSTLTGENGTGPELQFPGVFRSLDPLRLVVSFDGLTARLYTTAGVADADVFLGPELGLGAVLREGSYWRFKAGQSALWPWGLLLSALLFLPPGLLLGMGARLAQERAARVGSSLMGLPLPVLLLEGFVAWYRGGELRLGMMVLGVAVTSLGFAGTRWYGR